MDRPEGGAPTIVKLYHQEKKKLSCLQLSQFQIILLNSAYYYKPCPMHGQPIGKCKTKLEPIMYPH